MDVLVDDFDAADERMVYFQLSDFLNIMINCLSKREGESGIAAFNYMIEFIQSRGN